MLLKAKADALLSTAEADAMLLTAEADAMMFLFCNPEAEPYDFKLILLFDSVPHTESRTD